MNVKYKALYFPLLVVFVFVLLSITYRKLYFIYGLLENREKDETCGFKAQLQTPNTSHRQAPMLPDIYLIPDDNTLNEKNDLQLLEIFLKYVNTIQAHCRNVIRVGSMTDGGKEICVDGQYRPKAPCLIYSFGIQNNWSFDNMAAELFGCEIHCFDPSINKATSRISENIWFYNIGLGGNNTLDSRKWDVRTLQKIKEDLKHNNRTIDILKIDIEADEWTAIPEMLQSGVLDSVNQIAIEIHYKHGKVPAKTQLSILRRLYEAGFRIVMRDRNVAQVKSHPAYKYGLIILYELTLVNWIEYREY